jgi:hypothetical protein
MEKTEIINKTIPEISINVKGICEKCNAEILHHQTIIIKYGNSYCYSCYFDIAWDGE